MAIHPWPNKRQPAGARRFSIQLSLWAIRNWPARIRSPDRYQKSQGFSVALNIATAPEAERIFQTLAEKGTGQVPLQETFWALRFGMLVDQFGIPWMVNYGNAG
jgi:uncharacterized glyoxalase superfamily protein PhnB